MAIIIIIKNNSIVIMEIFFHGNHIRFFFFFCGRFDSGSIDFRQCLSQNNRIPNSPFSHHQFTDLTNLIDYSPPSNTMPTNIFHDTDDLNDLNGNKKFIAKRAQIGKRRSFFCVTDRLDFDCRYDKTSNRCSCFVFYVGN